MLPGATYPEAIRKALDEARVLVVLVGPDWFVSDVMGRRLIDRPEDWVRREIKRALERDILVVPVLFDEVSPLVAGALPKDIEPLAYRQAARVHHRTFGADVRRLMDQIMELVPALSGPCLSGVSAAEPAPVLADPVGPCPFRGLQAFRERDSGLFFGRADVAVQLAARVVRSAVTVVVGPSGCGKSSLVFAGMAPRLRRQWLESIVVTCRPGAARHPVEALAAALLPELEPNATSVERLRQAPQLASVLRDGRLAETVEQLLATRGAREASLLLVVDQFEELYAHRGADPAEFLAVLLAGTRSAGRQPRLRVVITVRGDFLDHLLEHPQLAEAVLDSTFAVGRMNRSQLRQAIEGPLDGAAGVESGLIDRILDDIQEASGELPLLQFALTLLWEQQDQRTLTHQAYERIGKVGGALAAYAEQVWHDQFDDLERSQARRFFTQLVSHRPDVGGVRRVVGRQHLNDELWRLGQRLASTRLVVTGCDADGESTVELAHEALIAAWGRLADWVEADKTFLAWRDRAQAAHAQWQRQGRERDALLRGSSLVEAEQWLRDRGDDIPQADRTYINASRHEQDRSVQHLRTSRRLFQALTVALVATLVVTLATAATERRQTRRLRAADAVMAAAALARQARAQLDSKPDLAALYAVAANRLSPGQPDPT